MNTQDLIHTILQKINDKIIGGMIDVDGLDVLFEKVGHLN